MNLTELKAYIQPTDTTVKMLVSVEWDALCFILNLNEFHCKTMVKDHARKLAWKSVFIVEIYLDSDKSSL